MVGLRTPKRKNRKGLRKLLGQKEKGNKEGTEGEGTSKGKRPSGGTFKNHPTCSPVVHLFDCQRLSIGDRPRSRWKGQISTNSAAGDPEPAGRVRQSLRWAALVPVGGVGKALDLLRASLQSAKHRSVGRSVGAWLQ